MSKLDDRFDELMDEIKNNNNEFKKLQGDILDRMKPEDVARIEIGYHTEFILKAFSDTLRQREGLKDLADGHAIYRYIELALIDAFEQITGEDIAKGEL